MGRNKSSGGAAPFGFIRTTDGFVHHPDEAPIRKLIFELFLKHRRKLTVATALNKEGFRTRLGAKFSDTTIDRYLSDPIVLGNHRDNYIEARGIAQFQKLKPQSERLFPPMDPLIDQKTWDKTWKILYPSEAQRISKSPKGIFGNKLRCTCGGKLSHPRERMYYYCNTCDNRIEEVIVNDILIQHLEPFPASQVLKPIANDAQKTPNTSIREKSLEKECRRIELDQERLYQIYMNGAISASKYKEKNTPLDKELSETQEQLQALSDEYSASDSPKEEDNTNTAAELWRRGSDAQKLRNHSTTNRKNHCRNRYCGHYIFNKTSLFIRRAILSTNQ